MDNFGALADCGAAGNMKSFFRLILLLLCLTAGSILPVVSAGTEEGPGLRLSITAPGRASLDGSFMKGDWIRLYSRDYNSAQKLITDKLILESAAEADGSAAFIYNLYAAPLSETEIAPAFAFDGNAISLKALYAVVSDGASELTSNFVYLEAYLETGVVNQRLCDLAPSTACGTAAGVLAMQVSYPASGDALTARMNEMRNYCAIGDRFSTGPAEYYLNWDHICNGVNKFIADELSGDLTMIDHRNPARTTEETLIGLLSTGRPAVIEVCYLLGEVTRDFQGISHWITINGFSLGPDGYTFRFSDPITVSYRSITSELLDVSNANVSYGNSGYTPVRFIGAFTDPLFSIE